MREKIAVAALVVLFGVAAPLRSEPIFHYFEDTTLVTGIDNIFFLDNLWDIAFVEGTFDEVFPSPTSTDFTGSSTAIARALFESDAMDFYRVETLGQHMLVIPYGDPDTPGPFGIPELFHAVFKFSQDHNFVQDLSLITSDVTVLWAVVTPADSIQAVPEPGSLLLLGVGLLAVIIMPTRSRLRSQAIRRR